jgi:hypothetical protein
LQNHRKDSTGGLVHVVVISRPCHGVDFIDKYDRPVQLIACIEYL